MKKTNKKGFTIVELVIVIAVIAILAAVLIPTFSGVINKANQAKDTQLVRNLNTSLKLDVGVKHNTMQDALDAVAKQGYDLDKINASAIQAEILWDSHNDAFVYLDGEGNINYLPEIEKDREATEIELWQICKEMPATQKYSIYAGYGWNVTSVDNLKVGFDAGKNTNISSINYVNSGSAQSVVIRTNGGTLTIDAASDTVYHYGYADSVDIQAVKTTSYHEHGRVPFMSMQYGRVVLESNSEVTHIHFERKTESSFDDIIVATANSVELPDFSRDPVTVGEQDILVVEVQSSNSSEFVWLQANGNGTIEDSKVLVSSTKTGEKTAVTEQSAGEHVKQIANTKVGDNVIEGGKTAEEVEAIKEKVVNEYYEKEFVPTDVPANAVAYSYNKDTKVLSSFDTLAQAYASVDEGGSGSFVIFKDIDLGNEVFEIANKSITLAGQKNMKPVVRGNFYIRHTSGNHTVQFSNLKLINENPTSVQIDHIKDESVSESSDDANILRFENCDFDATNVVTGPQNAVIAVYPKKGSGITGTALIVKNSNFNTSLGGKYAAAITTGSTQESNKTDPDSHAKNIVQPLIDNNTFINYSGNYGFVGSSAIITNNTFENFRRIAQIYAVVPQGNNDGELNVVISGNTFKNVSDDIFKIYKANNVVGKEYVVFDVAGTGDNTSSNRFENVSKLASSDGTATIFVTQLAIDWMDRTFAGITNPIIELKLASVTLTKSGDLVTGNMTLPNGSQTATFTQVIAEQGSRTGYYITVSDTQLWYFADKAESEHYFIDNENHVYIVKLVAGASTSLADMTFVDESAPESLVNKDGKIYNANFSISTLEGNTLYNATATRDGNKVTVTPMEGKTAADINLFISNNNDKAKMLITSNAGATAGDDTMIYVVPSGTAQINTYGAWNVTIDTDLVNYSAYNQQTITVNAEKSVTGTLLIDGAAAIGSTLTNNGSITRLYVYARTDVTNNGHIGLLRFTKTGGGTISMATTVVNAHNSSVINYGTINSVESLTKINVTNSNTGSIGSLWLHALDYYDEYAYDSIIVNNGIMAAGKGKNLNLYVRCTFTNNGTIGAEGRGTEGHHDEASCENYGGMIVLGYYGGRFAHDGLIFVNNGTIYAGARHNGTSHQQITFWFSAPKSGTVTVTIANSGIIYGNNTTQQNGGAIIVNGLN